MIPPHSLSSPIISTCTQSTKTRSIHDVMDEEDDTAKNSYSRSTVVETQKCDGPCHRLLSYNELRVFACGHVVCAQCRSEQNGFEHKSDGRNSDSNSNPNFDLCLLGGKCSAHAF